jgi:hypothetical protein
MIRHARTILALCLSGAPAAAQNAGHWGAIAIGPRGESAWAQGLATRRDAREAVRLNCADRCHRVLTFYRTCAAYATGNGPGFGWAAGGELEDMKARALRRCEGLAANCQVRVSLCADP